MSRQLLAFDRYYEIRHGQRLIVTLGKRDSWTVEGINLAGDHLAVDPSPAFGTMEEAIAHGRSLARLAGYYSKQEVQ